MALSMKWILRLSRVIFACVAVCLTGATVNGAQCDVTLHVEPAIEDGRHVLHIALTNSCAETLLVYESDLPWGNLDSLMIVIATSRRGSTLPPPLVLDDPGPTTVALKPGETVRGTVDLDGRFTTLRNVLRAGEVYVFWSFELRDTKSRHFPRQFGGFTIER